MRVVVLDVEGTTSSADHVRTVLFGYARRELPQWLVAHRTDPAVVRALRSAAALSGHPTRDGGDPLSDQDLRELTALLRDWIDRDLKATALKSVQGMIWQEGFAAGALTSHVYPDVPPALRRWHARGLTLCIFSSGSVTAQHAWFRHSPHGDLTPYLTHHFDTENAGAKSSPDSYRAITAAIGAAAGQIVFLSDSDAELRAARTAGWQVIGVRREEGTPPAVHGQVIGSFDELDITPEGARVLGAARGHPSVAR